MKIVPNSKPQIKAGDRIRLKGQNWDIFETVERIEGDVILFKFYTNVRYYKTNMNWEFDNETSEE